MFHLFQFFHESTGKSNVELKVMLPDKNVVSITINRTSNTEQVYQVSRNVIVPNEEGFEDIGSKTTKG